MWRSGFLTGHSMTPNSSSLKTSMFPTIMGVVLSCTNTKVLWRGTQIQLEGFGHTMLMWHCNVTVPANITNLDVPYMQNTYAIKEVLGIPSLPRMEQPTGLSSTPQRTQYGYQRVRGWNWTAKILWTNADGSRCGACVPTSGSDGNDQGSVWGIWSWATSSCYQICLVCVDRETASSLDAEKICFYSW